jgi:predicted RND superfamily exporter protein
VIEALIGHSGLAIGAAALLTVALIAPLLLLAPSETASTEPGGEVFDLRDEIDEKLTSTTFASAFIAEALPGPDGSRDILTSAGLGELLANERLLRERDAAGALTPGALTPRPFLLGLADPETSVRFTGVSTIADGVEAVLRLHPKLGTALADASDDQVKLAVALLLANRSTADLVEQFSVQASSQRRVVLGEEIDYWVSPAIVFVVSADNEALGGASGATGLAIDEAGLNRERYARSVQQTLRGEGRTYRLWGLAIDQTLAAQEQGAAAGAFIVLTVVAALAVVGLALRSYWATALTSVGIGVLMIWLKGFSALVGIKGGLVVDLIVPIAMVSLGVDFAVHAVRRYREERQPGIAPAAALRAGMAGVLGALVLAMLSDGIAFLSNVPSGIEAIVQFGIAAGIAVASSFTVLGIVVPLALMRVDSLRGARRAGGRRWMALAGSAGVTAATGAGVILLVAVHPGAGVAVLAATAAGFIGVPLIVVAARRTTDAAEAGALPRRDAPPGWVTVAVTRLVRAIAVHRVVVLPLVATVTVVAIVLALRLEATFDVKDFFASDSDIVVGLDKLGEHVGERGGEGGTVFVRGDIANPDAIEALARFVDRLADNPHVGTEVDGRASVFGLNAVSVLQAFSASPFAQGRLLEETGIALTDRDGNGLPDTAEQNRAVFAYATASGIPFDDGTNAYEPDRVRTGLYYDAANPDEVITTIVMGIRGTREQSAIREARAALLVDLEPLRAVPSITQVGLTGSPFMRDEELTATVDNLRTSLPIAAAGAFLLLLVAMRSLRFAVATVVPIGLVVAWLYAIMHLAGFALNFVSATIGAVSIGVGIDYSIHMSERFREELARAGSRLEALERAAAGTGVSLLASAGSSVVGFAIMGFAPMPMFSTYGILTAVMIFLALTASLVVLPALLMLVSSDPVSPHEEAGNG